MFSDVVKFDNSFSWMNGKKLSYFIEVVQTEELIEETAHRIKEDEMADETLNHVIEDGTADNTAQHVTEDDMTQCVKGDGTAEETR